MVNLKVPCGNERVHMKVFEFIILALFFLFISGFRIWGGLALYYQGADTLKWGMIGFWGDQRRAKLFNYNQAIIQGSRYYRKLPLSI